MRVYRNYLSLEYVIDGLVFVIVYVEIIKWI